MELWAWLSFVERQVAKTSVSTERNSIVYNELVHIKEALDEIKERVNGVVAEIASLRNREISDIKGDMKVLQDRAGRSGAIAGVVGGAMVSGIITIIVELLMRR